MTCQNFSAERNSNQSGIPGTSLKNTSSHMSFCLPRSR